jgi:hypothetical protein
VASDDDDDDDTMHHIVDEIHLDERKRILKEAVAQFLAEMCHLAPIHMLVPPLDLHKLGQVGSDDINPRIARKSLFVSQTDKQKELADEQARIGNGTDADQQDDDEEDDDSDDDFKSRVHESMPVHYDDASLIAEIHPDLLLPGQVGSAPINLPARNKSLQHDDNRTPTDTPERKSSLSAALSLKHNNGQFGKAIEIKLSPRKAGKETAESEDPAGFKRHIKPFVLSRIRPLYTSFYRFAIRFAGFLFQVMSFVSGLYYLFKVPFDFAMHIRDDYDIMDFQANIVFDAFGFILLIAKFRDSRFLMHKTRLPELRASMFLALKQILTQGISTMPFELIPWMFGVDAFVVLGVRVLRMIHFHKTITIINHLRKNKHITKSLYDVTTTLFIMLAWAHFGACINFLLNRTWPEEDSMLYSCSFNVCQDLWRFRQEGGPWDFGMSVKIYIISAYWVLTTFVSIGLGDLTPLNHREVVLCIFILLGNLTLYAFVLVRIMALMAMGDAAVFTKRNKYFNVLVS